MLIDTHQTRTRSQGTHAQQGTHKHMHPHAAAHTHLMHVARVFGILRILPEVHCKSLYTDAIKSHEGCQPLPQLQQLFFTVACTQRRRRANRARAKVGVL